MPPQKHTVKLLAVRDLTKDVKEFDIEKPQGEAHLPGQFMTIKISDGQQSICMRSYSVMYSPDKSKLQLCIKLVEGGRGSAWLFQRKAGDDLEIIYPAGRFILPENLADKLVFIGTGTGIVPLMCMMESLPEGFDKEVEFIFGVRFKEDLFYRDRIDALKKNLKNFKTILSVSRPEEGWTGSVGRVTDHLQTPDTAAQYFICGSGPVTTDTAKLLEAKGVPKENIFHENFG
jgi:ferredoxin-NADP reductase